jgi:hypothetical protein
MHMPKCAFSAVMQEKKWTNDNDNGDGVSRARRFILAL